MSSQPTTATGRFARVLKNRDVIALSFGAMIGWSWVLMTGFWVQTAGSLGTFIAFAVGGLAIAMIGLTYSELASAMPKAGGGLPVRMGLLGGEGGPRWKRSSASGGGSGRHMP